MTATSCKADLHIHSVLSPCGDLEMTPRNILEKAKQRGIRILGITDHNSTKHCELFAEAALNMDIFVLRGVEITSKEEIHCLAFFENYENTKKFQVYLDKYLIPIENKPEKFGYQPVIDVHENILLFENRLLISSLNQSIYEIEAMVHQLHGLFIPAHIDRAYNSLISQLGFIPDDLVVDAFEVSKFATKEFINTIKQRNISVIRSSDSHYIENVGEVYTEFDLLELSFSEIQRCLINRTIKIS